MRNLPQLPNNSYTQSTANVYTSTGFNAGDLVYYQNGDYKSAFNLTYSNQATFNNTLALNSSSALSNTYVQDVFTTSGGTTAFGSNSGQFAAALIAAYPTATGTSGTNLITVSSNTGIVIGQSVKGAGIGVGATVSNISGTTITLSVNNSSTVSGNITFLSGNIVQVWKNTGTPAPSGTSPGAVYFRIVNTSNVVQVAATRTTATYTMPYQLPLGVVALTGGGFVVYWLDVNSYLAYGIYSNTGAVVTAVLEDTGTTPYTTYMNIKGVALANGGFAIAFRNPSTQLQFRTYGATGTAVSSWVSTSIPSNNSNNTQFGLSSRSDSSIILMDYGTSATTNVYYSLYTTAGTTIVNNATIPIVGQNTISACDVTCLADGTTYVLAYYKSRSSAYAVGYRFLPTGNALSAENLIPTANINTQNYTSSTSWSYNYLTAIGLTGNNFMLVFTDAPGAMNYAFFNSSGTAISGTNANGTLPLVIPQAHCSQYAYVTPVEVNGVVNLYWGNAGYTQAYSVFNQSRAQVSASTYAPISGNSTVNVFVNTTNAAAGAIVPASVTPTRALYYAASNSSTTTSYTFGSTTLAPTVINSATCCSIASCTLPNGQFLIAYQLSSSPYTVSVSVYSVSGALQQIINVGSAYSSQTKTLKIAALSSGKFVIAWIGAGGQNFLNLSLYSSSFTLINTTTIASLAAFSSDTFDVVGLGGGLDYYAVAMYNAANGYGYYAVYNNTNTSIVPVTAWRTTLGTTSPSLTADQSGNFAILYWYPAGTQCSIQGFYQTAANTWSLASNVNIPGISTQSTTKLIYCNNGYFAVGSNGGTGIAFTFATANSGGTTETNWANMASTTTNSYGSFSAGLTGSGNIVVVGYSTTLSANLFGTYGSGSYGAGTTNTNNITTNSASLSITGSTATYGGYSICPAYGNNFVLAWLDANNYPNFGIYSGMSYSLTTTLTAGVSQSNTVSISPSATNAVNTNPGTILSGVALTTAPAGSTGTLLINGITALNSNYTLSESGAIDHTGQAVAGVRAIYNANNINLQGNS